MVPAVVQGHVVAQELADVVQELVGDLRVLVDTVVVEFLVDTVVVEPPTTNNQQKKRKVWLSSLDSVGAELPAVIVVLVQRLK